MCGQLIEARRARAIERAVLRAARRGRRDAEALARLSPADSGATGSPAARATLVRLVRSLDLERLRGTTDVVLRRLSRERGIGPWSVGVIALEGLGRYDHGLVGDLGLVKLLSVAARALGRGGRDGGAPRAVRGVAGARGQMLLLGWSRGLIPGADPTRPPSAARTRRAA